jgi:hypothetical protein
MAYLLMKCITAHRKDNVDARAYAMRPYVGPSVVSPTASATRPYVKPSAYPLIR